MQRKDPLRLNFTKKCIDALPVDRKRRVVYHDTHAFGLCLRVEPSGHKKFCWQRKINNRATFKPIGRFPELTVENARTKAAEYNAQFARWKADEYTGSNPFEPRHRDDVTLNEAIESYCSRRLESHAKSPEAACKRTRWTRDKYLSAWKTRPLRSITRKNVIDLHHHLGSKAGHVTANRIITLLRAVFNFAKKSSEWHGDNPASSIEKFAERSRDRFLAADEAARLFAALSVEPSRDLQAFVIISLFTGARRSDTLGMKWSDVNFETTTWTISDPKSRTPYLVPLLPECVEILRQRQNDSVFVFPGRGKTGHITGFKHSWPALLKRAKITGLTIHDLRRTLGSWLATGGESLPVIGKVLGHAGSLGATSIYARLQTDTVRKAIERATTALLTAGKLPT